MPDQTTTLTAQFPDLTQPLAVKPKAARQMLACGNTHVYDLINRGELESFADGGSRKITVASIKAYIARRVAAEAGKLKPENRPDIFSEAKEADSP